MADFFMGLSTALGWGVAGVYVALGVVFVGLVAGICTGAYLYKRRRSLKNSPLSYLTKSGKFERAKVKNTTKFYNFLKTRIGALKGEKKEKQVYTAKPAENAKTLKSTEKKEKAMAKESPFSKVSDDEITAKTNVDMQGKVSEGGSENSTSQDNAEQIEEIKFTEVNEQEEGRGL